MTFQVRDRRVRLGSGAPQRVDVPDVGPLRFTVRTEDGKSLTIDWTDAPLPRLARQLAAALDASTRLGGSTGARKTAKAKAQQIKNFLHWASARLPADADITAVTADLLDDFEKALVEAHTPSTARRYASAVFTVMRLAIEPNTVLAARLVGCRFLSERPSAPLDSYSHAVAAAVREACRKEIQEILALRRHGERMTTEGADPNEDADGWASTANLTWLAANRGPLAWNDIPAWARKHRTRLGARISEINRSLYLCRDDLVAFAILLALDTGIEAESLLELPADCLGHESDGWVELSYLKRRARGRQDRRIWVPDNGWKTPGGMIRAALNATRRSRARSERDLLLVAWAPAAGFVPLITDGPVAKFVKRHRLTDDEGRPLQLTLARLRKTHEVLGYIHSGGRLPHMTSSHGIRVAVRYADVPQLRSLHEQAVVDGLQAALRAVDEPGERPVVINGEQEAAFRDGDLSVADAVGMPPQELRAALDGEHAAFIASCRSFWDSGRAPAGSPCTDHFVGCLECRNAVFTHDRLPVLLHRQQWVEAQRDTMTDHDFMRRFGRVLLRIRQVLEHFSPEEIAAAHGRVDRFADIAFAPLGVHA